MTLPSRSIARGVAPLALLALLFAAAGCMRPAGVEVVAGSSVDSLDFRVVRAGEGDSLPGLASVTVRSVGPDGRPAARGASIVWQLVATEAARGRAVPAVVRYGAAPPDFVHARRPTPLVPGRYEVIVLGPGFRGAGRFVVGDDGRVAPR